MRTLLRTPAHERARGALLTEQWHPGHPFTVTFTERCRSRGPKTVKAGQRCPTWLFYNSGVIVADLIGAVGLASVVTVLLVRFGLLSVFAYISSTLCYNVPVTFRGDAWYAVHAYAVAAIFLGVAVVAHRKACAGQPLLKDELSTA